MPDKPKKTVAVRDFTMGVLAMAIAIGLFALMFLMFRPKDARGSSERDSHTAGRVILRSRDLDKRDLAWIAMRSPILPEKSWTWFKKFHVRQDSYELPAMNDKMDALPVPRIVQDGQPQWVDVDVRFRGFGFAEYPPPTTRRVMLFLDRRTTPEPDDGSFADVPDLPFARNTTLRYVPAFEPDEEDMVTVLVSCGNDRLDEYAVTKVREIGFDSNHDITLVWPLPEM